MVDQRRVPVDRYGTERLASKDVEPALVARLAEELGLPPDRARSLYERVAQHFAAYGNVATRPGELCYIAVDADEPRGKPIGACRRLQVRLDLADIEDRDALKSEGLAGMRRRRLVRLALQAQAQGALLSIEDLAYLTCSSMATVKRDLAACRGRGQVVPTRGHAGATESPHPRPARVARLFLEGVAPADIGNRIGESEAAVHRLLGDFAETAILCARGVKAPAIRGITGRPTMLVAEYIRLYEAARADGSEAPRLYELMKLHRRRATAPRSS